MTQTSFSARLRHATDADWAASVGHRFVDELLAGTVADDVLARYLVQDYQFCDRFVALLGQAVASAPTLADRLPYARQLGVFAADEDTYFVDSFDALGVREGDRVAPQLREATVAFDDLMREAAESRSYPRVVAVLLVAEWLYLDWATRTDDVAATRPEHVGWIDLHRGPDFTAWVEFLRDQLDAAQPDDPQEQAAVEHLFARAVACERAFFDAAYAG